MRGIEEIEADLQAARERREQASQDVARLKQELEAAQVASSAQRGHPWLGKRLKRAFSRMTWARGANSTSTVYQRGVLTLFGPEHRGCRGGFNLRAGDLVVLAGKGGTVYRFAENDGWEIDEMAEGKEPTK